MRCTADDGYL